MQRAVKHVQSAEKDSSVVSKIEQSSHTPYPLVLARGGLSQAPVVTKFVDLVNQGKATLIPGVARPNAQAQKILDKRPASKVPEDGVSGWRGKEKRIPRMTSIGAVGLVRASEIGGAAEIVGPVMERATRVRDRYKNV